MKKDNEEKRSQESDTGGVGKRGNNQLYLVRRLTRDRPDIAQPNSKRRRCWAGQNNGFNNMWHYEICVKKLGF